MVRAARLTLDGGRLRYGAQVARWLTAPRQQVHHRLKANAIPIREAVPPNDKELQNYLTSDPPYRALADVAPYGRRWPALPSFAKINGAIDTHVGAIRRCFALRTSRRRHWMRS